VIARDMVSVYIWIDKSGQVSAGHCKWLHLRTFGQYSPVLGPSLC